jgi:hypothetical protein
MPNHLEFVVRPSQSPAIRPGVPSQIFATPKIPQNTPITWGSAGDSIFDLKAHASSTVQPASWPETSRKYDVVRVYNPDDPEYQARNKISGDRFTMKFATNTNTENTEVISRGNTRTSA